MNTHILIFLALMVSPSPVALKRPVLLSPTPHRAAVQ